MKVDKEKKTAFFVVVIVGLGWFDRFDDKGKGNGR